MGNLNDIKIRGKILSVIIIAKINQFHHPEDHLK